MRLLDTGGSNDSGGLKKDSEHFLHMGRTFAAGGPVDCIMLVMHASETRTGDSFQFTLKARSTQRAMCVGG